MLAWHLRGIFWLRLKELSLASAHRYMVAARRACSCICGTLAQHVRTRPTPTPVNMHSDTMLPPGRGISIKGDFFSNLGAYKVNFPHFCGDLIKSYNRTEPDFNPVLFTGIFMTWESLLFAIKLPFVWLCTIKAFLDTLSHLSSMDTTTSTLVSPTIHPTIHLELKPQESMYVMCVYACRFVCVCVHVGLYVHVHLGLCVMRVCMCVCTKVCICVHVHML